MNRGTNSREALAWTAGWVTLILTDPGEQPTYLMAPTELFTAAQESLKVTVVVLDNGGYQSINRLATGSTGSTVGNEFRRRGDSGGAVSGRLIARSAAPRTGACPA